MFRIFLSMIVMTVFQIVSNAQIKHSSDTSFARLPGEGWWGGVVVDGVRMPLGETNYSFNLYGNDAGNQAVPLLISSMGRFVWSEDPFRYTFRNDSIIIDRTVSKVSTGKSGSTLRDSYLYASKTFYPSSGKWPDSLLVTSPQYNLWIELMYNPNQADVLNYAKQILSNGMPAGVLMIDDNWSNYYGHFDFDKAKFADAKALSDELHHMGFKVMLWICPFISPDSPAYRELADKKLLLMDSHGKENANWNDVSDPLLISWWNGYSACLDLSNPETRTWLKGKLDYLQQNYGIDGFKFDAGDSRYYSSPDMVSFDKILPNDHSMLWAEAGLQYPLNEYRAMWKMGGQPLVERLRDKSHSWKDLQSLVPNTIVQQLAGYTFTCPDLIGGGSFGSFLPGKKINQKLIVRSAQCHALMPMMQFSVAPWRILDETHLNAVKKIVQLREENMPYLMQVMRNAVKTGEPALRAMEYEFPEQGFMKVTDQFMLGDKLLVAPVVTESDTRVVRLPKGRWKYKDELIKGPVTRTITVPLDELPVFRKVK